MKRALVFTLLALKLTVIDPAEVKAETRLDQLLKRSSSEPSKQKPYPLNPVAAAPQPAQLQGQLLSPSVNAAKQPQRSERDRLVQERFWIKIIPAQNQ